MNTVSQLATYCAHCGHIEPVNGGRCETESLVFVHFDDCRCTENEISHQMFNALANAMTHMEANDCLLRRATESATSAMQPFADEYLNENSYSFNWINEDMTIKKPTNK